jgi:RNase P/RNase MRP subunit p30
LPYFESRLRVNFNDLDEIHRVLELCEKLQISNLILEPLNDSKHLHEGFLSKIKKGRKINIFIRINLTPRTLNEFKKDLKLYRDLPYIISLETHVKEIQIQAAKDSRIQLLSYSNPDNMRTATPGVISLAKQNGTFIECSLAPIMIKNRALQSKNLRLMYRFLHLILRINPYFIISGNFENLYDLRHPRNLCSICHTLLGMPLDKAKNTFSRNVDILLKQVIEQKENKLVHSGVRLIKGDK